MKRILTVTLTVVLGIAVVWIGNHFGLWWSVALVGLCIGLFLRGVWTTSGLATLVAVGSWGLDLLWQALHTNIGGTASVVAGIIGLGVARGYLVILSTLILAWLLCLSSTWAGTALRRAISEMIRYRSQSIHAHPFNAVLASEAALLRTPGE